MKILLADDSTTILSLLTVSLEELGHEVVAATNGQEAINLFQQQHPDLIILDVMMEGMSGFDCAKIIRDLSKDDWIPIIFLSGSVDDDSIAKGIDAGGDDYLTKPFSKITLAAKIKAMQRISDMRKHLFEATQQLSVLSSTDSLTGIYNRLQFNKTIIEKIAQSKRYKRRMALFFLDLDKFKLVNDTLGHQAGDELLIEVTKRLQSSLRADDFLARLGGDEFAIIFSDLEQYSNAAAIAQKLIDVLAYPYNLGAHEVNVSSSIGIACYPKDGINQEELLKNADIAMYHAKKAGRNNYKYFTKDMSSDLPNAFNNNHTALVDYTKAETKPSVSPLLLHGLVNKTRVCLDIKWIKKILPLVQLEMMPNSPDYVVGLLNLANQSIPVIDLGALLHLNRTSLYTLNTPILLCSDGINDVGLLIDSVLTLEASEAIFPDDAQPAPLILATPTIHGELSLLIHMKLIFAIYLKKQRFYHSLNDIRAETAS